MTTKSNTTPWFFDIYFFMFRTGIRIDDPGKSTFSETSSRGNLRGIWTEVAIFNFELTLQKNTDLRDHIYLEIGDILYFIYKKNIIVFIK